MNIVPTFPSPRHVNFQRCAFQTKLEGGYERGVRRVGFGKRCTGTSLNSLMNSDFKKKEKRNVDRRCRPCRGEHCAVSGAESFSCAAPCAESLTVLPAAAQQHFQQHTCVLPHRHSSRYLFSPPFLLYRKSHWERMRRLSSRSAALLFRHALVS